MKAALRQFDLRAKFDAHRVTGPAVGELGHGAVTVTVENGRLQVAPFTFTGHRGS